MNKFEIDQKIKIGKHEYELVDILMFFGLLFVGLWIRKVMMGYESGDWQVFLQPWTNQLKTNGFKSLEYGYYNYTPTYMYVLWFITKLPINTLYGIKFVSIFFDLVLAMATAKVIAELKPGINLLIPFGVVWLAPTVIANGSMWGQCDSIYVSFLILCVLYLLRGKSGKAMLFFAISFALKLQSVFLLPVLVLLFFLKKIRIRDFFLIPLVYVISIIPAWIAGRPFFQLLIIYYSQSQGDELVLSSLYPNVYYLIGNDVYINMYRHAGVWFTMGVLLIFMYYILKKTLKIGLSKEMLIQVALICGSIVVFLLPNMRERYSYYVDIIAIIYSFMYFNKLYVGLVRIVVSFMAITTYFRYGMYTSYEVLAVLLILLLIDNVYTCWKTIKQEEAICNSSQMV